MKEFIAEIHMDCSDKFYETFVKMCSENPRSMNLVASIFIVSLRLATGLDDKDCDLDAFQFKLKKG
jgi:hypothetical protein